MRAPLVMAAALALAATPCWSDGLRVPLALEEPVGVPRDATPVTAGIPLPSGRVRDPATLWIADARGDAVPSQLRVLERWPDGSARWVLADFLVAVGARGRATYALRDGRAPKAPGGPAVRVAEERDGWRIDTGAATVVVPRAGPALLRAIRPEATVRAGVAVDGAPARPVATGDAVLETAGPIRTEALLRGRDASGLAFETRVAAFAGSRMVRLMLTVTSLADRPYSMIASLPVGVERPFTGARVGAAGAARDIGPLAGGHELAQPDAQHATLDGAPLPAVGDGWIRAVGDGAAVTMIRRFFAEEWPQALRVDASSVTTDLLAAGTTPIPFGVGAAKTFELWVAVEDAAHATDPATLASLVQHPLVAAVDPAWMAATGALPNAVAPGGPGVPELLPRVETSVGRYFARNRAERWDDGEPVDCDARKTEHERIGAFGALNWGDWNFPGYRDRMKGCDAWGNLEYDLTQVLGLTWAATGWRPAWDGFVAAARHYRDVDVLHHAPGHEDLVGLNHPHKPRHFAVESKQTVDLGHTWVEGLLTHYRLTGEVRSLDAARGIADVLVRRRYKAGNPRQFGWPMIALAAAYDATRDVRYRDAAASYAEAALRVHQPTPAAGDWKMGILADGLASVYAVTGDARLRDWLLRYAGVLVAEPSRFDDPRYALPLGFLWRLTGTARYRDVALATVDRMPIGDWGKTLAVSGRTAFRILAPLGTPGARPGPAAPPRASAGGPKRPSPSRPAPARRTAR